MASTSFCFVRYTITLRSSNALLTHSRHSTSYKRALMIKEAVSNADPSNTVTRGDVSEDQMITKRSRIS